MPAVVRIANPLGILQTYILCRSGQLLKQIP